MDAQEIKTAVAHQEAARSAAEAPFVNLADPARALGANGAPAVSRRAPIWEDVPDEKWNDWRWQLSNRVNELDEVAAIDERRRRGGAGRFLVGDRDLDLLGVQPSLTSAARTTSSA